MKIILRFDDICPTMKWSVWEKIEELLLEHNIKPLLAVIPDNQDPLLVIEPAKADFWQTVKKWHNQGWTIGLHGYRHTYVNQNSGIIKLNNYSEFAGLTYDEQYAKIKSGLAIFKKNGITPSVWIAPAHSFDRVTVKALLSCGISTISDGFTLRPVYDQGILWIPQQVWSMDKIVRPFGLWTVCYHSNAWDDAAVSTFKKHIIKYKNHIVSVEAMVAASKAQKATIADKLFSSLWRAKIHCENIKNLFK